MDRFKGSGSDVRDAPEIAYRGGCFWLGSLIQINLIFVPGDTID